CIRRSSLRPEDVGTLGVRSTEVSCAVYTRTVRFLGSRHRPARKADSRDHARRPRHDRSPCPGMAACECEQAKFLSNFKGGRRQYRGRRKHGFPSPRARFRELPHDVPFREAISYILYAAHMNAPMRRRLLLYSCNRELVATKSWESTI